MISANRRLVSKNWLERIIGLAFYIALFALIGMVYSIFKDCSENTINAYMVFKVYCVITLFMFLINTKDFKTPKKIHKNTLKHFISELNPFPSGPIMSYEYQSYEGKNIHPNHFFALFSAISIPASFFATLWFSNISLLIPSILSLVLCVSLFSLMIKTFNKIKIPSDTLNLIDNIEDISEIEKKRLKHMSLFHIKKSGYIHKAELYSLCLKINDDNKQRFKEQEKQRQEDAKNLKKQHIYEQKIKLRDIQITQYNNFISNNKNMFDAI